MTYSNIFYPWLPNFFNSDSNFWKSFDNSPLYLHPILCPLLQAWLFGSAIELGYHSSKLCLLSFVWKNKLPENFILHKIFFFSSVVLIFLEGASRSPENCLADPKRTAEPSLRTTGLNIVWATYIYYKSLLTRVYDHAECKEYCKDFTVALKLSMLLIRNKLWQCIYGKENASKYWNCIISMFLASFNVYFVFGIACFMCICLKTAIWLFLPFWVTSSGFFGEHRLITLVGDRSSAIKRKVSLLLAFHTLVILM